ncbi:MAG: hypothetical protein ACRDSZ_05285 [Pseudonocardiaceae bacterium]
MTRPTDLATNLRAHARGLRRLQAATELLIGHHTWIHRSDFTSFVSTARGLTDNRELAHIDWHTAIAALHSGQLPCSTSESQILLLAASLADEVPINLGSTLTGLDNYNTELITQAIKHATGHR